MNRSTILALLETNLTALQTRFAVRRLALFGSGARDQLSDNSDIDILVEFDGPTTYDRFFSLRDHLEALFGMKADLVSEKGLKRGLDGTLRKT